MVLLLSQQDVRTEHNTEKHLYSFDDPNQLSPRPYAVSHFDTNVMYIPTEFVVEEIGNTSR